MFFEHKQAIRRTTLFENASFAIELEVRDNHPFIHFNLFSKLTPSVFKNLLFCSAELKNLVNGLGYPYLFATFTERNPTLEKLAERFGMVKIIDDPLLKVFVFTTEVS